MSETKENLCPDCGHLVNDHNKITTFTKCSTRLIEGGNCPCTRTYQSLVGEKQSALDIELCPCQNWASTDLAYLQGRRGSRHHPNCNGRGKWKPVPTGGTVAEAMERERKKQMETETSLQLLVIDFGDSCVVKVEKGEWHRDAVCKYQGSTTITLPLERLREELDGEKPVPRIEPPTNGNYTLHVGNVVKPYTYELAFEVINALSKLAGTPLPIYEPTGKWEEVGHIDDDVYRNTDLRVWRYTRRTK